MSYPNTAVNLYENMSSIPQACADLKNQNNLEDQTKFEQIKDKIKNILSDIWAPTKALREELIFPYSRHIDLKTSPWLDKWTLILSTSEAVIGSILVLPFTIGCIIASLTSKNVTKEN